MDTSRGREQRHRHLHCASGLHGPRGSSAEGRHVRISEFDHANDRRRSRQKSGLEWSGKYILDEAVASARKCAKQMEMVQTGLAHLAAQNERTSADRDASPNATADSIMLANLAYQITILSREAFVPAHKLCTSVIGLYMTEDFIRDPINTLNIERRSQSAAAGANYSGRIQVPSQASNQKALLRIKRSIELATEAFAKFEPHRSGTGHYSKMREVLRIMRRALQELHATALGSIDLLNIFIYIDLEEKEKFAQVLAKLSSMQKSDLLEDISRLRRLVDWIPLQLEKLSWASSAVYRLVSGCNLEISPIPSLIREDSEETLSVASSTNSELEQEPSNESIQMQAEAEKNIPKPRKLAGILKTSVSQKNEELMEEDILNGNISSTSFIISDDGGSDKIVGV